jgi:hypothetical protein
MGAKNGSASAPGASIAWRTAYWLIIVGIALGLYRAYVVSREMRAIAQQQIDQLIAGEDQAFCEKFGIHTGTNGYVSCCQELSIVRQKQRDRDRAASQGFL